MGSTTEAPEELPAEARQQVVYGTDDRVEVFAEPSELLAEIARKSTLALIPNRRLARQADGTWNVESVSAAERHDLCDDQPFAEQPAASDCSATLIGDDLVLTAQHCVWSMSKCSSYAFAFNYWYSAPGKLMRIDDDAIYHCRDVIFLETNDSVDTAVDLAIVQLDRPALGFEPVGIFPSSRISLGMAVVLVGTTASVPIKIDRGGSIRTFVGSPRIGFESNMDSFLGSSGSGVFSEDGLLIGVLSKGQTDFESAGDCQQARLLDDATGEETSHFASLAVDQYCSRMGASAKLCAAPVETGVASRDTADDHANDEEGVQRHDATATGCSIGDRRAALGTGFNPWQVAAFLILHVRSKRAAQRRAPRSTS